MNNLWCALVGFSLGVYLGVTSADNKKPEVSEKPAAVCPCDACDCCKECCEQ